jgi:hypothetical protein
MTRDLSTKDIRTVGIILLVGLLAVILCLVWASRTVGQVRYTAADLRSGNIRYQESDSKKIAEEHNAQTLEKVSAPKDFKLTEVQLLKLQVVQKDAFLLKAQIQDLQRQFGDKIGDLQRTAEKIKLENSWPPDTRFDMDKLEFSAPTKEEKK